MKGEKISPSTLKSDNWKICTSLPKSRIEVQMRKARFPVFATLEDNHDGLNVSNCENIDDTNI